MSAKYVINQIHRFNFLAVNDFRVNLRSLYVGMAEQLARGIKIRTEGKHHCGERVAARVIGDFFIDSCRCHPFGQYLVNPEKPDVPLNKNDAFQKVQKRRVQEKR